MSLTGIAMLAKFCRPVLARKDHDCRVSNFSTGSFLHPVSASIAMSVKSVAKLSINSHLQVGAGGPDPRFHLSPRLLEWDQSSERHKPGRKVLLNAFFKDLKTFYSKPLKPTSYIPCKVGFISKLQLRKPEQFAQGFTVN